MRAIRRLKHSSNGNKVRPLGALAFALSLAGACFCTEPVRESVAMPTDPADSSAPQLEFRHPSSIPFTELTNPMTPQLDGSLEPEDFMRTLRAADSQIFSGFKGEPGLLDPPCLAAIEKVADAAASRRLVFSGCGTSGRVGYLTARRYEAILDELQCTGAGAMFGYTCAGGDSALLLSDEMPEDDPLRGRADLAEAMDGPNGHVPAYLVGITCGLSAPYVAGQVAALLAGDLGTGDAGSVAATQSGAAVMGFNPVSMSRAVPVEGLKSIPGGHLTIRDVFEQLQQQSEHSPYRAIINPVIGPEPVTASSRMKGGSASLIILDAICLRVLHPLLQQHALPGRFGLLLQLANLPVDEVILEYNSVHARVYTKLSHTLPAIMQQAASSLRQGGRLLYIGAGSAGWFGCVDCSEMPDTYGAPYDQCRAFVAGGWASMGNTEGDISHKSRLHRIGLDHFAADMLPSITCADTVVVLVSAPEGLPDDRLQELADMVEQVAASECTSLHLCAMMLTAESQPGAKCTLPAVERMAATVKSCGGTVAMMQPNPHYQHSGFTDYGIKLATNAISTFGQASGRGVLYKSLMIGTGPANDKIYDRCVRLISDQIGVSATQAENALIRSIYQIDNLGEADRLRLTRPRAEHINRAVLPEEQRHQPQVILPVALLVASAHSEGAAKYPTVAAAQAAVAEEPRVSVLLSDLQTLSTSSVPYLRSAVESDRSDLYRICVRTGDSGADGSLLYSDLELLGRIYVGPYLSHSIKYAFALVAPVLSPEGVSSQIEQAQGYVLGVLDTVAFIKRCEDGGYWRALKGMYPLEATNNLRPNECDLLRTEVYVSDRSGDSELLEAYPSHMHIDLEPQIQGKGYGRTMVLHLLDALRQAGSCGVHLKMASSNARAFRFYCKLGFEKLRGAESDTEWTLGLKM